MENSFVRAVRRHGGGRLCRQGPLRGIPGGHLALLMSHNPIGYCRAVREGQSQPGAPDRSAPTDGGPSAQQAVILHSATTPLASTRTLERTTERHLSSGPRCHASSLPKVGRSSRDLARSTIL
ncbi:hypothetical protein [Brachybacterium sacelli]|uniref:hypothetical protein n=1 Tax=Brachybacterium sacelli TaxID=173364 RepID=UPI00361E8D26